MDMDLHLSATCVLGPHHVSQMLKSTEHLPSTTQTALVTLALLRKLRHSVSQEEKSWKDKHNKDAMRSKHAQHLAQGPGCLVH